MLDLVSEELTKKKSNLKYITFHYVQLFRQITGCTLAIRICSIIFKLEQLQVHIISCIRSNLHVSKTSEQFHNICIRVISFTIWTKLPIDTFNNISNSYEASLNKFCKDSFLLCLATHFQIITVRLAGTYAWYIYMAITYFLLFLPLFQTL